MRHKPTEQEGRESLVAHAVEKALEARAVYGGLLPGLAMEALETLLCDRKFVRHPVRLDYDAGALDSGEFAHPDPVDPDDPSAGFIMHIHPAFEGRDDVIPLMVAYQLVTINYGDIAGHEAAESFGAALCGMATEPYYQTLCQLADSVK
jgi:hypothetical protein